MGRGGWVSVGVGRCRGEWVGVDGCRGGCVGVGVGTCRDC